jgi:hypothetical protein
MAVEIGSLVVRGTFGTGDGGARLEARLAEEVARLRRELRSELRDMLEEAERRGRER